MKNKQLLKLSLICFIISVAVFAINYFVFHFVTDEGITFTFHREAEKPFVSNLIGILGVLFFFSSAISLIIYFIKRKDD